MTGQRESTSMDLHSLPRHRGGLAAGRPGRVSGAGDGPPSDLDGRVPLKGPTVRSMTPSALAVLASVSSNGNCPVQKMVPRQATRRAGMT